jgi:hypothetical protein
MGELVKERLQPGIELRGYNTIVSCQVRIARGRIACPNRLINVQKMPKFRPCVWIRSSASRVAFKEDWPIPCR